MAIKKINENPKITDKILLEINTPDSTGCFSSNPYKVDNVIIYYIERDFLGSNYGEYDKQVVSEDLQSQLKKAEVDLCDDHSQSNLEKLNNIKEEIRSSSQINKIYYKERSAIKVIGSENFPAWLSTDVENASLSLVPYDESGNSQFGHFVYEWDPKGSIREGDYFVCWTWTPLPAGEKLSAHIHFTVEGNSNAVVVVPYHSTPEGKYETLLERYLPELYKFTLSDRDITPRTTENFNLSIAKGFSFLEDMANQIIDLFDSNALHESMLSYLSNTFAIKLRSSDPTLWRRQIKEAFPLFKRKGTLKGLQDAFSQSGMKLNSFIQYWQLTSKYNWIETFVVEDKNYFILEKEDIILSQSPYVEGNNLELYLKRQDSDVFILISNDNVSFEKIESGLIKMNWIGDQLSAGSVDLFEGDTIKIKYQFKEIPSSTEASLDGYIQLLPLMDQRNENDQTYPPKNWNVRLIAEDDPLFSLLIPVRHPFADPLQFGWLRTEFAYSENIYNAEEYNGSTRPSFDACRIDKNFIDPCGACLSSSYSVDIGIEELSNDRIIEAQDILNEYTPFHAQIHSINFAGEVNEFIQSPVEQIDTLITIDYMQTVLSGNSNPIFYRNIEGGLSNWIITRENLTDQNTVLSGKEGVAYNDRVVMITPDYNLNSLGVIWNNHVIKILPPSVNYGDYTIDQIQGSVARVTSSVVEPLDKSAFTFNLFNITYKTTTASISQDNLIRLSDEHIDFAEIGVKTTWDKENTVGYFGDYWRIKFPDYSDSFYEILNIDNGVLIIKGDASLPTSDISEVSYVLYDDEDNQIEVSETGNFKIKKRGRVNLNDTAIIDIFDFVKPGYLLNYDELDYNISEIKNNELFIDDYDDGDAFGVSVQTRKILIKEGIGYFGYRGLALTTENDHEAEFGILNGDNSVPINDWTDDSNFKENYLFKVGEEFYKIISINKEKIVLEGREQDWMTEKAGGTNVPYSLVHFPKKQVNVGFYVFDQLDRSGKDPVIREVYSDIDKNTAIVALSSPKGSGVQENVSQEEGVQIEIEMKDGEKFEGEL